MLSYRLRCIDIYQEVTFIFRSLFTFRHFLYLDTINNKSSMKICVYLFILGSIDTLLLALY